MAWRRLSILGVGLLGGSIGLASRRSGTIEQITGLVLSEADGRAAIDAGAIDRFELDPAAAVAGADGVVLCVPVGVAPALLRQIATALPADAVVTDVGSTKRSIMAAAAELPSVRFVGSHPMTGGEQSGVRHARATLFDDAFCLITAGPRSAATDVTAVTAVETFWQSLGAKTRRMSPGDHDAAVASASHLPHAVAAAVVAQQSPPTLSIAGKGFADTTRVAAGDAVMWRDIFLDNGDHLGPALRQLAAGLGELADRLDGRDEVALLDWLSTQAKVRGEWGIDFRQRTAGPQTDCND